MANRGCGCKTPDLVRITEDGIVEASFDGGNTWTPYNGSTEGITVRLPLPIGFDVANGNCSGAESATNVIKLLTEEVGNNETGWNLVTTLVSAIAAALAAFFGIGQVIAAIVGAVVVVIFLLGREAFNDLWDAEKWEELRCIFACIISADASFTEAQWQECLVQVRALEWEEGAKIWINFVLSAIGHVGLTNAARTLPSLGADCSDCGCSCDDLSINGLGTDLEPAPDIGASWWRVTTEFAFPPVPSGNGDYYAIINVPACCCLTAYDYPAEMNNAPPGNRVAIGCDDVTHTGNYGLNAGLVNTIYFRAFEQGTITFKIEAICP